MIPVTNLRNGNFFLYKGEPYKVLNYEHIKVARGGATIKVKVRNVLSGGIKEIAFSNGDKAEEASIENKNLQYLYKSDDAYVFMDMENFSQIELPIANAEYEGKFLLEGKDFQVIFFQNKPISVTLPASMFYIVKYAPMAVKGDTSKQATKTVTLENEMEVDVPLFIREGDTIKVNTESGLYVNRA